MEEVYEPKLAPVIIPTLNRIDHLKRCIDSLSNCVLALQTDLIIGLDYPFKEEHLDGYNKICSYLDRGIKGFNSVTILKREVNFGPRKNINDLRNYVFSFSDCVICSEDDNVFSPNFLVYLNQGLTKYKDDRSVFAVCGYNFPFFIKNYSNNAYVANVFCAWGYGIWKDRVDLLKSKRNTDYLKSTIKSRHTLQAFRKYGAVSTFCSLIKMVNGDLPLYGDVVISSILMKENMYCVFPIISKVRNTGFDGSGLHCDKRDSDNMYSTQTIDLNENFIFDTDTDLVLNEEVVFMLKKYFRKSYIKSLKQYCKLFIFRIKYNKLFK